MELEIPIKPINQTKSDYLRQHKEIFLSMWKRGMSWREIGEEIREVTGMKLIRQMFDKVIGKEITVEMRVERLLNQQSKK